MRLFTCFSLLSLAFPVFLTFLCDARAAIVSVPCCSLSAVDAAITAASDGDTIQLASGSYTGCPMTIDGPMNSQSLTLIGNNTVFDCDGTSPALLQLSSTSPGVKHGFQGIVFTNMVGLGSSGLYFGGAGDATFENCSFVDNNHQDSSSRALAFSSSGTLALLGGRITRNLCACTGAAVHVPTGSLVIRGAVVTENTASLSGGGIVVASVLNATGCTIAGNSATVALGDCGGTVFHSLTDSNFTANSVGYLINPSATTYNLTIVRTLITSHAVTSIMEINVDTSEISFINCTFSSNTAWGNMNTINAASVVMSGTVFTGNQAVGVSAIAILHGDAALSRVQFVGNSGGNPGLYFGSAGTLDIQMSQFTQNTVVGPAFGVALFAGAPASVTIDACSFTFNYGPLSTATVYVGAGGSLQVDDTLFANNIIGGGGAIVTGAPGVLNRMTVVNNVATGGDCAGISHTAANMVLSNSTISSNTAAGSGGGLCLYPSGATYYSIINTQFRGNTAVNYAAGIFVNSGSGPTVLKLADTVFTAHSVNVGSGIGANMYVAGAFVDIVLERVVVNGSYANYGGIYLSITDSSLTVANSKFVGCLSYLGGGAFRIDASGGPVAVQFLDSSFDANKGGSPAANLHPYGRGGAVSFSANALLTVAGCTFSSNVAAGGGALYYDYGAATSTSAWNITGNVFINNYANGEDVAHGSGSHLMILGNSDFGTYYTLRDNVFATGHTDVSLCHPVGAVMFTRIALNVVNCSFHDNQLGGLYVSYDANLLAPCVNYFALNVINSSFVNNAGASAILIPAACNTNGPINVLNSVFRLNTQSTIGFSGGAIESGVPLYVEGSLFEDNSATIGSGAISMLLDLPLTIVRSTFNRNQGSQGGALGNSDSTHPVDISLDIYESVFSGNSGALGDAIYCAGTRSPGIVGTTFRDHNNHATLLSCYGCASYEISDCVFVGNNEQQLFYLPSLSSSVPFTIDGAYTGNTFIHIATLGTSAAFDIRLINTHWTGNAISMGLVDSPVSRIVVVNSTLTTTSVLTPGVSLFAPSGPVEISNSSFIGSTVTSASWIASSFSIQISDSCFDSTLGDIVDGTSAQIAIVHSSFVLNKGVALKVFGGCVTIVDVAFTSTTADYVALASDTIVRMDNALFVGNTVSYVMYLEGGNLVGTHASVCQNTLGDGSAIYMEENVGELRSFTFSENAGAIAGLEAVASVLNVSDLTCQNQIGTLHASLVATAGSILNVTDATFQFNGAPLSTGVFVANASVYASDVNGAHNTGTVVLVDDSVVTIKDSTFSSNTASRGAALIANSPLTISGSLFINNRANDFDGGAMVLSADGVIHNSLFSDNTAPVGSGGAIACSSHLDLVDVHFNSNVAATGGAVNTSSVRLSACFFIGNTASTNSGGGVFADTADVTNCTFSSNSASNGAGGGIDTAVGTITTSRFTSNTALTDGGAVCGRVIVNITSTIFTGNSATNPPASRGGAVYSVILNARASVFTSNVASLDGGAVYALTSANLSACNFTNGKATNGAAVNAGDLSSTGCLFSGNTAAGTVPTGGSGGERGGGGGSSGDAAQTPAGNGGAIYANAWLSINDTLNTNSAVKGNGGAGFVKVSASIQNSVVRNNSAVSGGVGGGFYCQGCNMTIGGARLTFNTADTGGALYCVNGSFVSTTTTFLNNTATSDSSLPEAECSTCGCCSTPLHTHFPVHNCVLQPGASCSGYTCDAGYKTNGTAAVCSASGQRASGCIPFPCPLPETVITDTNMVVSYSCEDYSLPPPHVNCTVFLSCRFGYRPNPSVSYTPTSVCLPTGWSVALGLACEPLNCTGLDAGRGGTVSLQNGHAGDVSQLTCAPGWIPPATTTATCWNTTQGWSQIGSCTPQPCNVQPIANGVLSKTTNLFSSDNVTLTCAPLPDFTSDVTVFTCIAGDTFSPPLKNCTAAPCDSLMAPLNGNYTLSSPRNVSGSVATFTCDDGFRLNGTETIPCVHTHWTGTVPVCSPVTCSLSDERLVPDEYCTPERVAYYHGCNVTCRAGTIGIPNLLLNCSGQNIFNPSVEAVQCQQCPATSYAPFGSSKCIECLNGHVGIANATEKRQCLCDQDYYESPIGEGDCVTCPPGGECVGGKVQPVAAAGFYPTPDPLKFTACTPAKACAGNGTCAEGYKVRNEEDACVCSCLLQPGSYLCGSCDTHYYKLSGECVPCPKDASLRVTLFILLILLVCTILIPLAQPSEVSTRTYGLVSISIVINFMQVVSTLVTTSLTWSSGSRSFMSGMSGINLNVELAAPECVVEITFYTRFQAQLLAPLAVLGAMGLYCMIWMLISWLLAKRPSCSSFKPILIHIVKCSAAGFIMFMTVAYLTLAQAALSLFSCQDQVGGFSILTTSPETRCYTPEWNRNAIFAVFSLIFYVVGVPLGIILIFVRQRSHFGAGAAREDPLANFFVLKYQAEKWYWEALVMVRKFFVVLVTLYFTESPFVQVILLAFVFFFSAVLSLINRPYNFYWQNVLDDASMVACTLVIFGGLATSSANIGTAGTTAVDVLEILAIALVLVFTVVVLAMELYITIKVTRLKSQHAKVEKAAEALAHPPGCAVNHIIAAPTQTCFFYSAGRDGSVAFISHEGAKPVLDAQRNFSVPDLVTLVTVPATEYIVAVTTSALQLWHASASPQVVFTLDLEGHKPTAAALSASKQLFVGFDTGVLRVYQLNVTEPPKRVTSVSTLFDTIDGGDGSLSAIGSQSLADSPATALLQLAPAQTQPTAPTATPEAASTSSSIVFTHEFVGAHATPILAVSLTPFFIYTLSARQVRRWTMKQETHLTEWGVDALKRTDSLTCMTVAGAYIFCGSTNSLIYRLHMENGTFTILSGHTAAVTALHVEGTNLISAGHDGAVRIWDAKTGAVEQRMPESEIPVASVFMQGNTVIWGRTDGKVASFLLDTAWNFRSPEIILEPVYKRFPRLRPRVARGPRHYKALERHESTSSVRMHLLMDDFKVNDFDDTEAAAIAVAMEESMLH